MKNLICKTYGLALLLLLIASCKKEIITSEEIPSGPTEERMVSSEEDTEISVSDSTPQFDQLVLNSSTAQSSSKGRLRAKLRVLTHNVYGLSGCNCDDRAKAFGNRVANAMPKYDIVGVQEYYNTPDFDIGTCDAKYLSNAIWSTGRYRNSNNYYRFYPEVSWQPDGGVGIFTLHPIKKFDYWKWENDKQPRYKAAEGFIFARIEVPYTGVTVDAYIVHLNSGGGERERRKKQLKQLAYKIASLSRYSGNPVIVMGDFNIGGPPTYSGNDGYKDIMEILKNPKDLWMTAHPYLSGFTIDGLNNAVTRSAGDKSRERIDYIFVVTNPAFTNSRYTINIANSDGVRVVDWHIPGVYDHRSGTPPHLRKPYNVSDHYGVEASLEIREK